MVGGCGGELGIGGGVGRPGVKDVAFAGVEETDVEFGAELVALYVLVETGGLGGVDFDEEGVVKGVMLRVDEDVVEDAALGG